MPASRRSTLTASLGTRTASECDPVGIIAGGGSLPGLVEQGCRSAGRPCLMIGLEGQADVAGCGREPDAWVRLGAAEQLLGHLRKAGVTSVVLAGKVRRPSVAELRPDARAFRILAKAARMAFGDDGLLRAIVGEFESEGFAVVGADTLVDELLAPAGLWTRKRPSDQDTIDIARGTAVGRALGAVDVGQAVVVQGGQVLAVEAAEGTTAMIRRAGRERREGGGGVLVKLAKPGQERRVDLPTIGPETVTAVADAGLAGIAIEAGSVLAIDRDTIVARADANDLFVAASRLDDVPAPDG